MSEKKGAAAPLTMGYLGSLLPDDKRFMTEDEIPEYSGT
jgi:hypothetical protein